ncbi:TetR/AcrR family transcriptional regulator [bacterium C-53]|nr:TetR/AcrR family transcriptional regulator [Lachnospiraceae bacterium]NBI04330.1 TetR/AcrR family transcriptional regulator [Lachnospiraceae bacterium]RKJ08331.1 TetR/AcrR family transcriptional regulator [bacterium C-53]
MNEAFYELSEEKQQAIYNASMEVFGDYEYKRASTDLIASKAGVSKGLLFYYFHNKKALYLHTFEYVSKIVEDAISDTHLSEITDFFELISYATEKKVKILIENPFIMRFSIRCFYSQKEDVSSEIQTEISNEKGKKYDAYFKNLELGKFKEGIDPEQIYHMLVWMTDGYLHSRQMEGKPIEIEDVTREFTQWTAMFKSIAYKEEFQ